MARQPLEIQTLYAELLERLTAAEAGRAIGALRGSFVAKTIKGEVYLYFQTAEPGGGRRQVYVGRRDAALDRLVDRHRTGAALRAEDDQAIRRLCTVLRAGGALTTDAASARVLEALARGGVFHLGGVLVGTHAFIVLGNLLGAQWQRAALRTFDLDIAGSAAMHVAVPELRTDVPAVLAALEMGFLPVPQLNPRHPSTAFKVRGSALRVDLLTPGRGIQRAPILIPRLHAAAQPLPYLDYLLSEPVRAAVIDGGGILVNVPAPARFALHKLLTAAERPATMQVKVDKDLDQAAQLVELLLDERPDDLHLAWEAARASAGVARRIRVGLPRLRRRAPEAAARLAAVVT
jgi:hypothetical protein